MEIPKIAYFGSRYCVGKEKVRELMGMTEEQSIRIGSIIEIPYDTSPCPVHVNIHPDEKCTCYKVKATVIGFVLAGKQTKIRIKYPNGDEVLCSDLTNDNVRLIKY